MIKYCALCGGYIVGTEPEDFEPLAGVYPCASSASGGCRFTALWNKPQEPVKQTNDQNKQLEAVKKLVIALDDYFESDTFVRFVRLMQAEKRALKELGMQESGWACGYRMLKEHQENADKVWGVEHPWPEFDE